jgi:hypothetical protein
MSAEDAAEALALDPSRFQGEGGDLTLLYALRKAEQAAEAADEVRILHRLVDDSGGRLLEEQVIHRSRRVMGKRER